MPIRISGKNVDTGQALREHVETRLSEALGKYFDGGYTGHVVIEREGSGYKADCNIHLDTGVTLQATGRSHEIYAACDQAAERVGKRLRRYKRKLKDYHAGSNGDGLSAQAYVLEAPDEEEEEVAEDFAPVIVAESTERIRTLTVSMAVLNLDFTGAPVLVFTNAGTDRVNIIYRRPDGNIGWIDPSTPTSGLHAAEDRR